MALHRRLLQDIAEFESDPYQNIHLHIQDDDLQRACLLLTPNDEAPLHLTMQFGADYPLNAPVVTIQSRIVHPNVYGDYICASILNTEEGYTPAYTLKSISIQLLSFFSSERIEQTGGGFSIALDDYRQKPYRRSRDDYLDGFLCVKCGFGGKKTANDEHVNVGGSPITQEGLDVDQPVPGCNLAIKIQDNLSIGVPGANHKPRLIDRILALPNEVLLLVIDRLDTEDLLAAAKVCSQIKDFVNSHDTIRLRELQCFCFKTSFMETKLGIGIHVNRNRQQGSLESEFDLLSQQAFQQFLVRRSIHGLPFEHWVPLPLSHRHWRSVSVNAKASLERLANTAGIPNKSGHNIETICNFMNTIVVRLSREAEQRWGGDIKSTLTHVSEKAVESYFSLFHLLLCLATESDQIVRDVNRRLQAFVAGSTSKDACPNLGELLVAALISGQGLTPELTTAIVKEAVLRNVVWMLDPKGANMAELSYIEPSPISDYRLQRTFEATKTSYRLLMFFALFYRTARSDPRQSLSAIRDELFNTHGAPPKGAAEKMATEVRKIKEVNTFPAFFKALDLQQFPNKENFCSFLKRTITESVHKGYSSMPLNQGQALALRKAQEPRVEVAEGVVLDTKVPWVTFFPAREGKGKGKGRR